MTPETLDQFFQEWPDLVTFVGFDGAILGICERFGQEPVILYDYARCIDILRFEGLSEEDAIEYFEFNVIGAYVGPKTPAFAHWPTKWSDY